MNTVFEQCMCKMPHNVRIYKILHQFPELRYLLCLQCKSKFQFFSRLKMVCCESEDYSHGLPRVVFTVTDQITQTHHYSIAVVVIHDNAMCIVVSFPGHCGMVSE